MSKWIFATALIMMQSAALSQTLPMNYKSADIQQIIEDYSKATGQSILLDPGVRGRVTMLNSKPLSYEEAFNEISSALAIHGYAISKQGNSTLVQPARTIQRSLIEVTTQLPELKPERMVTWIRQLNHISSDDVLMQFRNVTSKDGDINSVASKNQLIITDWASNIHRFAKVLETVDQPTKTNVAKIVEQSKSQRLARKSVPFRPTEMPIKSKPVEPPTAPTEKQ